MPAIIPAILGFLQALPQLLKMIQGLMEWINKASGNDPAGFIVKAGDAFKQLNEAKTQEEYSASAKALSDLISKLPSK